MLRTRKGYSREGRFLIVMLRPKPDRRTFVMAKGGNKSDFGEHATKGGNKHEFGEYATNGGNKREFGEHATKSGYI